MRYVPQLPLLVALVFVLLVPPLAGGAVKAEEIVRICDDTSPWPPFSYPLPGETDPANPARTGAMTEFLDIILADAGFDHTVTLRPWKRCLEEVKNSAGPPEFEIAINSSYSAQRAADYHVSAPVYTTTPAAFFSADSFPDGLKLSSLEDLKGLNVCGVRGFSYEEYGLSSADLSSTAGSLESVIKMVSGGRCDVVVSSAEPILGAKLVGEPITPPNVKVAPVPGVTSATFHILIAKGSPRGETLLARINEAIAKRKADGTWEEIFSRYLALMKND